MLKILTEQEMLKFVREMVKGRDDVDIAVLFWVEKAHWGSSWQCGTVD
jgi:hypothetical protein